MKLIKNGQRNWQYLCFVEQSSGKSTSTECGLVLFRDCNPHQQRAPWPWRCRSHRGTAESKGNKICLDRWIPHSVKNWAFFQEPTAHCSLHTNLIMVFGRFWLVGFELVGWFVCLFSPPSYKMHKQHKHLEFKPIGIQDGWKTGFPFWGPVS